jgi:RimJ/RimL family protein N-acetyltransferase
VATIETARLAITPFGTEDVIDELLEVFNSNPDYLETSDGKRAYDRADVESYLSGNVGRGRCLAIRLRADGSLVGTAGLIVPHSEGCPWIALLIVHGDHQGDGIGREAVHALEAAFAEDGWQEVRLAVLAGNERTLPFWRQVGYEVVDERRTRRGDPCWMLAKALPEQP